MQNFNDVKICDKLDKIKLINDLTEKLIECCVANFGVYPDNIQNIVLQKAIKIILNEFSTLTIEQIEYSFDRVVLNKIVTVSVDDLINPIKNYFNALKSIKNERLKMQKEIEEKEYGLLQAEKFEAECLEIYRKSILEKNWIGTIFHSAIIAQKYLSDKFTLQEKIQMRDEAIKIKFKNDLDEDVYKFIGFSQERIMFNLAVINAIEKQIIL